MLADVAITHSDGTVTLFPLSGRGEIVTHVSKARHGAPKVVVALPDVGHPPDDGTRLRNNANGTSRIDRPASVTGGQHETIHYNNPD